MILFHINTMNRFNICIKNAMNSSEIQSMAKQLQIQDFIGTFAIDQLKDINSKKLGSFIFNTDVSKELGTHWIGIHIGKKHLSLFDPLGIKYLDLSSIHLKKFLLKFNKHVIINRIQIQSNTSHMCGVHCMLFCYIMSSKHLNISFESFLSQFDIPSIEEREKNALELFSTIFKTKTKTKNN